MLVARVIIDIATRELDAPFDYLIPEGLAGIEVGSCVLVDFANRPAVGYVVEIVAESSFDRLKPLVSLLGGPYFDSVGAVTAAWIAENYVCPLSEAVRLFTPPGGAPRAIKVATDTGEAWTLRRAGVGPVDDRWAMLAPGANEFKPSARATLQRALLDALRAGPVRVAELAADLGTVDGALKRLAEAGAVQIERRRRHRDAHVREKSAPRPLKLTDGQTDALAAISSAMERGAGDVLLLDGVTGSGKTEVYLQAIEKALGCGGTACVLVPEISLTPQTVGRFRSRFGDEVAVLHSRLSAGERFDQWDMVRRGEARIVVGARSALFAPLRNLALIVIDEEHEGSYKQSSAPRYHARDVAARIARESGATLVLGSASPSMESRHRCETGEWTRIELAERATGGPLPPVTVVDMTAEFADGHRSMFSRPLIAGLQRVAERGEKAVLFLNRRGFASFLLCRECGFVPECEACSTSLTYHDVGKRLVCHHCGAVRPVPAKCPRCGSPYLRQFGAGTQRVEADLGSLLPNLPIVRMDADTTLGKGGHERALAEFEALSSGVLLGTQMIAKGLDYPEVTLVGVINADTTLHLPDFRAGERTYQLLEQVAGRAGRGREPGHVIVQTYWPDHPAIRAAAAHDPSIFYDLEEAERLASGYPPYGRLANVLAWGKDRAEVARVCDALSAALSVHLEPGWELLGPSPAPLSRLKGVWRWHLLLKAPPDAVLAPALRAALKAQPKSSGVLVACDIDPLDLL
ncbi:MAG: primosomal protein N' [Coriobacteriia bacterium]|nr:primosomal protein N' [Coriobacteriia bacterium]